MKKILTIFSVLLSFSSLSIFRIAQAACYINGQEVPCEEMPAWFGPVMAIFGFVMLLILVIVLVFWLKMLFHAISNPVPNKAMWILIIIFFGWLGALIYYFIVKKAGSAPAPTPVAQPVQTPPTISN